jgi:cytoskeletal protein CcmA (bactofilin family)
MIKIKGLTAEDLNGFMDAGTEFHGELRFHNTFRIDGKVKGRIVSENTLIVGESGQVDAEVECGVVSIRGTVKGRIQGRERIELLSGSKVHATLVSPRLVIEEGAFFQGDCEMTPTAAAGAGRSGPAAIPPAKTAGEERGA